MELTSTPALLRILLTHEELSLALRLVNAATLPGLRVPQAQPLTLEQATQGLIYAERSLRARELARITADGNFVAHTALLSAVSVCAYADHALLMQHIQPDHNIVEFFGSQKDGAVVSYTLPEPGLYQLAVQQNSEALVKQALAICGCEALTAAKHSVITVPDDVLRQAREQAEQGMVDEAAHLLSGNNDVEAAAAVAHILSMPHAVSVWISLQRQSDDTVLPRELTVLHTAEAAWLMAQQDGQVATRTLRPINTLELFEVMMAELNPTTLVAAA